MKKSIFTLTLFVFAAASLFTNCKSPAEKVEASKENVEDAQQKLNDAQYNYAMEYSKFKMESDKEITANEKLIADLKEYSKSKKNDAKIEYDKTIAALEEQNQALKQKAADYKDAGRNQWQSFKDEFNHDMYELGQSLKDLTKNNVK